MQHLIQTDADDYYLNRTIDEALKLKSKVCLSCDSTCDHIIPFCEQEPIFTCMKNESFEKILRHLATSKTHRLFVVDEQSHVIGVVSVSDIFNFILSLCLQSK